MYLRWTRTLQRKSVSRDGYHDWDTGQWVNRLYERVGGGWRKRKVPLELPLSYLRQASLVENQRVDGKLRRRTIANLGSIDDDTIRWSTRGRALFWQHASDQLDSLGLGDAIRHRAEVSIQAVVPRPSEDDLRRFRKQAAARQRELRAAATRFERSARDATSGGQRDEKPPYPAEWAPGLPWGLPEPTRAARSQPARSPGAQRIVVRPRRRATAGTASTAP